MSYHAPATLPHIILKNFRLQVYHLITIIVVLTATFGYINFRFIKLPGTIGIMLISLVASLVVIGLGYWMPAFVTSTKYFVSSVQFDKALIGSLDLMLFNNKEAIVQSVDMYMKNQTSCDSAARVQTVTVVGTSETFKVCAYADGSFIELNTLTKGPNSSENQKLNQVLGL